MKKIEEIKNKCLPINVAHCVAENARASLGATKGGFYQAVGGGVPVAYLSQ
jgi:hypothetical protein